ncbi:MAG: hypothetical protein AAF388_16970 [Bacteroidota bacterium]
MRKIYCIAALLIGIIGCTFPSVIKPKFEKNSKEVINDLKSLSDFEEAGIRWNASTFKGESTHELIIQLLNGKDLNRDQEAMNELGKEALKIVFNSIENEAAFQIYKVIFVDKKGIGPVSNSYNQVIIFQPEDVLPENDTTTSSSIN